MDFRPLATAEQEKLRKALFGNVKKGTPLRMDPKDTSFLGADDEVTDDEVINAIKSVPTHY